MPNTVPIIGIAPQELPWIRLLVQLLRHPNPAVPELVHHALNYLSVAADRDENVQSDTRNSAS
jgi:hypothetical protein